MKTTSPLLNRRSFLQRTAIAGSSYLFLTSAKTALTYAANDKLNIAGIGVGGQGRGNMDALAGTGQNIVALCDVDQARAGDVYKKYPQAKAFTDFRRMLDEMDKSIDAVMVATPDHTHAVSAVASMKQGKHVYCEKPLTRTVYEARVMRETAAQQKVVTQMGNQGSANGSLRRAVEMVWGGVIGEVREAYVWFDGGNSPLKRPTDAQAIPANLDWDLWLGPAEFRPYHSSYLPASWRGWRAFGSGIVGDFGCHTGNIMFRALKLDLLWNYPAGQAPQKVLLKIESKPSEVDQEGYPRSSKASIAIPARGNLPPVKLSIYAKERPSTDLMLGYPQGGWGDLLVGSKGSLYSSDPWNTNFFLLPETRFEKLDSPPPASLPRSKGHHQEFVDACKGRGQTFSSFSIGGPLTEIMQLANLAALVEGTLEYDIVSGKILNHDKADQLLHRKYRQGWVL